MKKLSAGLAFGIAVATAAATPFAAADAAPAAPSAQASDARQSPAVAAEQSKVGDAARALGLGAGQRLQVKSVVTDADGTRHVRYERTFQGLKVIGGDLVVERSSGGSTKAVRWNATKAIEVATSPKLTVGQARSAAGADGRAASGLVVYAGESGPRLAYDVVEVGTKADQTPSRLHTVVDAATGATLDSWDEVVEGTGSSM